MPAKRRAVARFLDRFERRATSAAGVCCMRPRCPVGWPLQCRTPACTHAPASTAQPAVAPAARLPAVMRHCGTPSSDSRGLVSTALATTKAGTCCRTALGCMATLAKGGRAAAAAGRRRRRRSLRRAGRSCSPTSSNSSSTCPRRSAHSAIRTRRERRRAGSGWVAGCERLRELCFTACTLRGGLSTKTSRDELKSAHRCQPHLLRAASALCSPLRLLQQAGQGVDRCRGRPSTQHMASSRQVRAASQPALQTAARLRPPLIPPPPSPFSRVAAHQDGHGLLGERAARLAGHAILACLEHCPQLRRRQLGGGLGEGRLLGGGAWSMLSARAAPGSAVQCPAPEHAISLVRPAQLCLPLPFSWGQPCTTTTSTATLLQR